MAQKCAHCDPRTAHHSEKLKKDIASRLNRIEGQIRGVRSMIEEDVYCDEVLNQITSVQAALGGVGMLLLEHHVKSCVAEQLSEGKTDVIDELMSTIRKMKKQ
jgi:DNA-binding FrmR family transcriptional regulator